MKDFFADRFEANSKTLTEGVKKFLTVAFESQNTTIEAVKTSMEGIKKRQEEMGKKVEHNANAAMVLDVT